MDEIKNAIETLKVWKDMIYEEMTITSEITLDIAIQALEEKLEDQDECCICEFTHVGEDQYPCIDCSCNYVDRFKKMEEVEQ